MTSKQLRQILSETTAAAATRHPKAMPCDDFEADVRAAIENYQKLNADQKKRHLDFLQKVLDDSAWAKCGTGVKGKNIPFNKEEAVDWPTVAEFLADDDIDHQLQEQLEEIGFNKDAQERAAALFYRAVEERSNTTFAQRLAELISDCVPSPFISNEDSDIVEALANRIQQLQGDLAYVESENQKLAQELHEETETSKPPVIRSPRRSTVNENMLEPDLDAEDAYYNQNQYTGRMREYLKAMGDDLHDD